MPTHERVRKLADILSANVNKTTEFVAIKAAVVAFVEAMDTDAHILGDGDFKELFDNSLMRRGKASSAKAGK